MLRIQKHVPQHQHHQHHVFGNNRDDDLKHQIIGHIYNTTDIAKYNYDILEFLPDLTQLLQQKHYVSVNFSGLNCLLVFTKIKDKYFSYLIDRKPLSYNVSKVNYDNVKLISTTIKLDPSIYLGTVLDGIYITTKGENIFVITDVYSFKGRECSSMKLNLKLHTILSYLETNYNETDKENELILTVNKLYDWHETENLVNNIIPTMKNMSIRGICYYPEISGKKLIYLFNNDKKQNEPPQQQIHQQSYHQEQPKQTIYKTNTNVEPVVKNTVSDDNVTISKPAKTTRQIYIPLGGANSNVQYVFEMKKTQAVDVYVLNLVKHGDIGPQGKPILHRKQAGIALIPDKEKSAWCNKITENNNAVLVTCVYNDDKHKWMPVALSNKKRPSLVSEFKIIEIDQ